MKRFVLTLAAVVLLAASTLAFTTPVRQVQPLQDAQGLNICTAFSINTKLHYWMTAAHCTIDSETESGDPVDSYPYMAGEQTTLVYRNVEDDIAIVASAVSAPSVDYQSTAPYVGEEIFIYGYAYGVRTPSTFQGHIANVKADVTRGVGPVRHYYAFYDCHAAPGNSGSAVFGLNGKVVGVLQVGVSAGWTGGAPWDVIIRTTRKFWD